MANLTSANSVLMLAIVGLYNTPQQIQGYSADDAFTSDTVSPGEAIMGVDGKLSGGFTPYPVPLHITLQADSESMSLFDNWILAQNTTKSLFTASGTILVPGLGQQWTFTKGILTSADIVPPAKKIMQPRKFSITFQSHTTSPYVSAASVLTAL